MSYMFGDELYGGCISLSYLPDISKWNMKNIMNITSMFCNCVSLVRIPDISKWEINDDVKKDNIFYRCVNCMNIPQKYLSELYTY